MQIWAQRTDLSAATVGAVSTPVNAPRPPAAESVSITMITLVLPVPAIAGALWFAFADIGLGHRPETWSLLVPVVLAAAAYAYCEVAGFRAQPLPYGGDPAEVENRSWQAFNRAGFVRFVLCEAVFMVTIPIAFVVDSYWPILVGALLAVPLIAWECWPSLRNRRRFAASLEAGGAPSYLLGRTQDRL